MKPIMKQENIFCELLTKRNFKCNLPTSTGKLCKLQNLGKLQRHSNKKNKITRYLLLLLQYGTEMLIFKTKRNF